MIHLANVVRAALQIANARIEQLPPPHPVELRFQVANDQTGDEAVWVAIVFADDVPEDEILAALPRITKTIEDAIQNGFTSLSVDVLVYAIPFRRSTAPRLMAS